MTAKMRDIYKCRVCGRYIEDPVHCGEPAILVLDSRRRIMLSKLMSGLLRHFPWEAGLTLDDKGWVSIDELVRGIRERWRGKDLYQWVTREHVVAVALLDPKGRFEVRGNKIRARYGHSIMVVVDYVRDDNIMRLYHGTSKDVLDKILAEGIKPMRRQWVHLSLTTIDACETGRRHGGKPVVLTVNASCLRGKGIQVYRASKSVYVAKYVPPECIESIIECERQYYTG